MCVSSLVPMVAKCIIAYKVMIENSDKSLVSFWDGGTYEINKLYDAEVPKEDSLVERCDLYDRGFHAYQHVDDAQLERAIARQTFCQNLQLGSKFCVVEVVLEDVRFIGSLANSFVYVAEKCKFLRILGE